MTKISICCFYLRIFPERQFRTATYVAIGLNAGYLIAFVLISVFQCRPLPGAWHHWDGEKNYHCNNINAQGWCAALFNMALDIIVMALPLKQLYHLNLSWRKKGYVMCMFSLGILYLSRPSTFCLDLMLTSTALPWSQLFACNP